MYGFKLRKGSSLIASEIGSFIMEERSKNIQSFLEGSMLGDRIDNDLLFYSQNITWLLPLAPFAMVFTLKRNIVGLFGRLYFLIGLMFESIIP